jgi:hypothetical protein
MLHLFEHIVGYHGMKSASHCIAIDMCQISLIWEVPTSHQKHLPYHFIKANESSFKTAITFKNVKINSPSKLKFHGIYGKYKIGCSCSIIKSKAVQSSLYNENVKKTMSPFMIISHV